METDTFDHVQFSCSIDQLQVSGFGYPRPLTLDIDTDHLTPDVPNYSLPLYKSSIRYTLSVSFHLQTNVLL